MPEGIRTLVLLTVVLVLAGCSREQHRTPSGAEPAQTRPAASSNTEVNLEVVKHSQLLDVLKKQHGKVVVLDVWASWCEPCKQEFPRLVQLHQRHAGDDVVCMSVSLDEPMHRENALAFLKSKGAAFPNYLLDEGDNGWDKLDIKGIPAVFVYDRQGKLARKFTGDDPDNQFTYADVEKFVQELIAPARSKKEK